MDTTRMLGPGEGFDPEEDQEQGSNPLLAMHLLLQGRYWLAVLLALALGVAGAVVGYKTPKPTWSCAAPIQIRPTIASVLFDKAGNIPMYDQFVLTQMYNIRGQRCIDLALSSQKWLREGRSNSAADSEEFQRNLTAERQGENIVVTYTHENQRTAVDGLGALIDAYAQLTDELNPDNPKRQQPILERLRTEYEAKLAMMQKGILNKAQELNMLPEAVQSKYQYKLADWNQAEEELKLTQRAIRELLAKYPELAASAAPVAGENKANWFWFHREEAADTAAAPQAAARSYTVEEIARVDGQMRRLLAEQALLQKQLEQLSVGPASKAYKDRQNEIDLKKLEIETYRANWEVALPLTKGDGGPGATVLQAATTMRELLRQEESDQVRLKEAKAEATQYGDVVKYIREQQDEQKHTQLLLDETRQKLEALRVDSEQAEAGHILIPRDVGRPVYKDRRIPIAAGSGLGGLVLGFGLMVVWGLLDRRLRTIDQARNTLGQGMRVLGMLPSLPKNLEDPASANFAALCVHHIRMLLQVMPRLNGHPAIAVTSPSAGDGKTSLTLSLALSYAASGRSTLLIDCDMVGAGLTRRVNAIIRRRIGQILIRENLLTPAELREALSTAQRSKRKLGEVLVEEGYVDAQQLASALTMQGETSLGLLDVLRGEVLEECVADTGTPRLWILPVGSAMAEHGVTISPEGFRAVLDQARKRFDVILVDTGPIPGSIESSVATSQVDGVVLTVSRGEQGALVKRASEHLRDIGARALGLVFNRATPEDFASSYGSMSSPSIPERVRERKDNANLQAFGPVATAVVGQHKALKEAKESPKENSNAGRSDTEVS